MIDIEKCKSCPGISALVQSGLPAVAINEVAREARHGLEGACYRGPEAMEGGWTKCHAGTEISAALRGAAIALQHKQEQQYSESFVTV